MQIIKNYNLVKLNTFGISARAKFFVELENELDLKELFSLAEFKNNEKLFLGGGSNILFTKDFDGIVILNKLKGIEVLKKDKDFIFIKSMGGVIWNDLVNFSVERGYSGIENLTLVPGTVGAAPVQNIGAYGVELKDSLYNVEAYEIETGKKKIFSNQECEFGYRSSVFKNRLKGKYFIFAVTFRLSKKWNKKIEYRTLKEYIEKNNLKIENVTDISRIVASIRKSKLPNPAIIGNAGSFFKNVFVEKEKADELLKIYPDLPYFAEDGKCKIPAGWLIEKCGWKGKKVGNVGVHDKQALVLVNYGGATGEEVKNLSEQIISSVFSKFGLILEKEVNLI